MLVAHLRICIPFFAMLALCGCRSEDDGYSHIFVRVKNSTDRTIIVHYQTESWLLLGLVLENRTTTIDSMQEKLLSHYYDDVPDIHITGIGIDLWFNALSYENDRFTVRQSDVVEGDG